MYESVKLELECVEPRKSSDPARRVQRPMLREEELSGKRRVKWAQVRCYTCGEGVSEARGLVGKCRQEFTEQKHAA